MRISSYRRLFIVAVSLTFLGLAAALSARVWAADADEPKPPAVGEIAADFTLKNLDGEKVRLSELAQRGPVAIIVLRGWPGYQCPICSRQVADLLAHADKFKTLGANVLLIYPGPAERLDVRAREFLRETKLPEGFTMVTDPAYTFTKKYHLRWDAPRETAYPSTFVVDADRRVHFAKVSKTHGDRTKAKEVVAAVEKVRAAGDG